MSPVLSTSKRFEEDCKERSELRDAVLERSPVPKSRAFKVIQLLDFCSEETLALCSFRPPLPVKIVNLLMELSVY